jgi:superfamily II DNA or RNA helicase
MKTNTVEMTEAASKIIRLRPYQDGAIKNLRTSIGTGNKRVLLQASTGAGKTIVACEMIRLATIKGKRALFIAHRKEIIKQTSDKLDAFGINHGVIMANHERKNDHVVQVASIQTLMRRDKPEADLVIIDEAHLSCSVSFKQIVEHYDGAVIIGLTATPIRGDGKGLGEVYSDIISVVPMTQLIAEGYLVKPRVFAPFTPDLKKVRISKGDYDATETANLMDNKEITADIVKHWLKVNEPENLHDVGIADTIENENLPRLGVGIADISKRYIPELSNSNDVDIDLKPLPKSGESSFRKTIVFASSVEHSKNIVAEFVGAGISAKHLDATSPANVRDQTLQQWRDGEFTVLGNFGLFIEGLDVPAASCVILARPTKSLTIYLQAVGRIMRPHESKIDCVILDCAGLTYEHGFVDDAREWSLDGKIKRPKEDVPAVHICEECFAAYSKAQHPNVCPNCGYETLVEQREVEHVEVEMVELTPPMVADLRKQNKRNDLRQCKTLDDYLAMARRYRYKMGWAYHKWEDRKSWLESHGYPVPVSVVAA